MERSFCVTVVTEIDFVQAASEDGINRHLADIIDAVRTAAGSISTRVTAAVNVTYCEGGVIGGARERTASAHPPSTDIPDDPSI